MKNRVLYRIFCVVVAVVLVMSMVTIVASSYVRNNYLSWLSFENIPIAESGLAILGFLGTAVAAVLALTKWDKERAAGRIAVLAKLIEDFKREKAEALFRHIDESGDFDSCNPGEENLNALRHCSYVCYLHREKLITDDEFGFFRYQIDTILRNPNVQRYLSGYCEDSENNGDVKGPYYSLVKYACSVELWVVPSESIGREASNEESTGDVCIRLEEITEPLIVIRFNRSYEKTMTEQEVYEKGRGYWRISRDRIANIHYVLFVAERRVRAVYKVVGWEDVDGNRIDSKERGFSSRLKIVGEIAEKSIHDKYINRSTSELFKHGNMNPVKYFNS